MSAESAARAKPAVPQHAERLRGEREAAVLTDDQRIEAWLSGSNARREPPLRGIFPRRRSMSPATRRRYIPATRYVATRASLSC